MYQFGISVVIEKEAFMLRYTKGIFTFEPYDDKSISLSCHLSMQINKTVFMNDLFDILDLKFAPSTSYNFINLAIHINDQYLESQTISQKDGIIYLVSDGEFTKIGGTSYNLHKRLLELQTGNAKKLSILGSYPTLYMLQSERLVQNKYKSNNILNEWFSLDSSEISNILNKKEVYSNISTPFELSLQSMINILHAQYSVILDVRNYEAKKLRRLFNKMPFSPIKLFSKIDIDKFTSPSVASYLSKKINIQKNVDDNNHILKKLSHVEKLNEYIEYLNSEKIKLMSKYGFYYSDDEGIYRYLRTNNRITDEAPSLADMV